MAADLAGSANGAGRHNTASAPAHPSRVGHDPERTALPGGGGPRAAFRPRRGALFREPAEPVGGHPEAGRRTRRAAVRAPAGPHPADAHRPADCRPGAARAGRCRHHPRPGRHGHRSAGRAVPAGGDLLDRSVSAAAADSAARAPGAAHAAGHRGELHRRAGHPPAARRAGRRGAVAAVPGARHRGRALLPRGVRGGDAARPPVDRARPASARRSWATRTCCCWDRGTAFATRCWPCARR